MSVQHREEKQFTLRKSCTGTGYVEARDLTEYKVALIEENIERSGLDNIEAVCQDATINDEASYEKGRYSNCRSSVFRPWNSW